MTSDPSTQIYISLQKAMGSATLTFSCPAVEKPATMSIPWNNGGGYELLGRMLASFKTPDDTPLHVSGFRSNQVGQLETIAARHGFTVRAEPVMSPGAYLAQQSSYR